MSKISDHRAGTLARRFATLIAARNPLRQQADDWEEIPGAGPPDSGGGGRSKGGAPDPVLARVLRTPAGHGLADQCVDVANRIDQWIRDGNDLARAAQRLLPVGHPVAEMMAKHRDIHQAGGGICQRCKRDVPGIRENPMYDIEPDRLKSGFCYGQPPHCYAAWVASGRRDRARFIEEWKRVSGTGETAGTSTDDANAVPFASSGGELRPGSDS